MRSLRNCGVERDRRLCRLNSAITLIAAEDGVDRIENGDVNDCHRATGPGRSELFAKGPDLAEGDGSVIESAGINGDRVPAMNGIERIFWRERGARRLRAI